MMNKISTVPSETVHVYSTVNRWYVVRYDAFMQKKRFRIIRVQPKTWPIRELFQRTQHDYKERRISRHLGSRRL